MHPISPLSMHLNRLLVVLPDVEPRMLLPRVAAAAAAAAPAPSEST